MRLTANPSIGILCHMNTTNVVDGGQGGVTSRQKMPRQRKSVKAGERRQIHLSVMVDADVMRAIDTEAERMTEADPMSRVTTRTDVVRHWLKTMAAKSTK